MSVSYVQHPCTTLMDTEPIWDFKINIGDTTNSNYTYKKQIERILHILKSLVSI